MQLKAHEQGVSLQDHITDGGNEDQDGHADFSVTLSSRAHF